MSAVIRPVNSGDTRSLGALPGMGVNSRAQVIAAPSLGVWTPFNNPSPGSGSMTVTNNVVPPDTAGGWKTEPCVEAQVDDAGYWLTVQCELTTPFVLHEQAFGVEFYMEESPVAGTPTLTATVTLAVDSSPGTYTNTIQGVHNIRPGRWNRLTFGGIADSELPSGQRMGVTITNAGASLLSTIKRFRLQVTGVGGHAPKIWIRNVHFGTPAENIIVLTNDDGFAADGLDAIIPLHEKYQLPLSCGLITGGAGGVGTSGKVTYAQARQWLARLGYMGISFTNHTVNHWNKATMLTKSEAELTTEFTTAKNQLLEEGLNDANNSAYDFIAPFGLTGEQGALYAPYQAALVASGIRCSRGTLPAIHGPGASGLWDMPCHILANDNSNTIAWKIIRAIQQMPGGGVINLCTHKLGTTVDSITYNAAQYEAILQAIRGFVDAKTHRVMNLSQFVTLSGVRYR